MDWTVKLFFAAITVSARYGCRICLKIYELKAEAEACCENEERIRPFYKCGDCGAWYPTLDDVRERRQAAE